ncbi:MAG: sigma-70 family RNA polymerase sigma factor [Clostridia bacterium]|nr:sigma-70 family RNA polymerase sigma factor [Clostridia bacterium]
MLCFSVDETETERACLARLYDRYHRDIYKRILNILGNEEDTKDVMQETWTAVALHVGKFLGREDESVRAYLLRVARNQAITFLRARKRERTMTCTLEDVEISDDGALMAICESGGVSEVLMCFEMLNEAQRDVLNLYYLHRHSLREIAVLLGLSEQAVASRFTRGRKKLIELLKRRGYHE